MNKGGFLNVECHLNFKDTFTIEKGVEPNIISPKINKTILYI